MALNTQNTDAISFKKLSGKAHTQQNFAVSEEGISSNIQISYTTVFGNEIDGLPETNGLVSEYQNDGVVERIKFEVDIIPDTEILVGRSQGYRLKLPADYNANGYLFPSFSAGTYLHQTLGKLQVVPSLYGTLKSDGSTEYDPKVYQTNGSTQITKFDSINWYLDTYNGILFVQDPPAGYNVSAARPGFVEAFLYVGQFVNDALGGSNNYWKSSGVTNVESGTTISGATVKFSHAIEYVTNISSGFTKHSLVDVNYVTGLTAGSGFTQAGGGLTKIDNVIGLGGTLTGDTIFVDTRAIKKGLEYGGDYSTGFTQHSLVDVNFVTGITSQIAAASGVTFAGSGLLKIDNTIVLGGNPLTQETLIEGNDQSFAITDTRKISLSAKNLSTSETIGINLSLSGFTITDTRTGETGIKYAADYSSGFTKHSLVDVNFVTGITGGFTADNGLTKNGINVRLGGVLDIESTVIEGTGDNDTDYRELYLGSSSGPIGYLEMNTDYGIYINDLLGGGFHVDTYENGDIEFKAFGGSGVLLESKLNGDNTSNKAELNVHYNGLYARNTSNVRSGVTTSLYVSRELFAGSGGPQTGFGVKLNFDLTNSLLNVPNAEAGIAYIWNDATESSEDGRYDVTVHANGLEKKVIEIDKASIKYPSDFSSGFTKYSLVDVNYVTGLTSNLGGGSITGSSNGLTTVGKNIVLGGTLTGATIIDSNNHSLIFDYGTTFETGNTPVLRATVGGIQDVAHLAFRHNSARSLTHGFTDIKLGTNAGNPNSPAGGNITIGQNILTSLVTSGSFSTSPWFSTFRGDRNIGIGFDIATGWTSMGSNQGTSNIMMGVRAGKTSQPFSYSVVMGFEASAGITGDATTWESTVAIGTYALSGADFLSGATGSYGYITAVGGYTGKDAVFRDGYGTVLLGYGAGMNATMLEDYEVLIGGAGQEASLGRGNIGIGERALWGSQGGSPGAIGTGSNQFNVAVGVHAMEGSGPSEKGTYVGCEAGQGVVIGQKNTGYGSWSLPRIRGHHNMGIGPYGGFMTATITGNGNTFIGPSTGLHLSTLLVDNVMVIGNPSGVGTTTGYRPIASSNTIYMGSVGNIVFTQDYDGSPKTVTFNSSGLTYGGDYSSNFSKHSIVDVNYVTGITSTLVGGSFWKTSGTTTLSGLTTIDSGANALVLKTASSPNYSIAQFNQHQVIVGSTNGTDIVNGLQANNALASLRYINSESKFVSSIEMTDTLTVIKDAHESGMRYYADYTVSGVSRHGDLWIPNKKYVDSAISSAVSGITGGSTTINGINITGGSYTATTTTDFIGISGESAVTLYLPLAPTPYQKIIIADIKGNALTANITINGNGKTINGSITALINTNYGAVTLIYNTVNWTVVSFA